MNGEWQVRSVPLLGEEGLERLSNAHVAVFGIGGVGGYVCEGLARCGIGEFTLVDKDVVSVSNINRQIIALSNTVGRNKTDLMSERIEAINPNAIVHTCNEFFLPINAKGYEDKGYTYDFSKFDYVIDAVDTVTAKLEIIKRAYAAGTSVISAMGAGNKLSASRFEVADIFDTSVCPLAKVMRHECKKNGIDKLKVVYSKEEPVKAYYEEEGVTKRAPGSIVFSPAICGLLIAEEVVKDIIGMTMC